MKKEICFYGSDVNLLSGCVLYADVAIRRKEELSQDDIQELDILSELEEKACFKQPFAFISEYAYYVLRVLDRYSRHAHFLGKYDLEDRCKSLGLIIEDMMDHECE